MTTNAYAASSALITNPRRGFFVYTESHYRTDGSGHTPLVAADLLAARVGTTTVSESGTSITFAGRSIVFRYFYMERYRSNGATIEQAYLDKISADLAAIKSAGCVARLRFAYDDTFSSSGPWTSDVNVATTTAHQAQLAPIINAYADVVDSVDCGLIGTYGEHFYTSNYTTSGNLDAPNATDVTNRNTVIRKWLDLLDPRIFVNLRYIGTRQAFLGSTSPNPGGSLAPRLGHHNDALLADDGNYGTYTTHMTFAAQTIPQARAYLDGIANVPVQGESANYNPPGSDWSPTGAPYGGAAVELAAHHFSSLNALYHPDTLRAWGQANIDTAQRSLGYRLRLVDATIPGNATPGSAVPVTLRIANDGWAAPTRAYPLRLVLVSGSNTVTTDLGYDVRACAPGSTVTVSASVPVPSAAGTYAAYLVIPDPTPGLQATPAYGVQLANSGGIYSSTTGRHDLGLSLTVGGAAVSTIYSELYNGTPGQALPASTTAYSTSGTGTLTYSANGAVEGPTALRATTTGAAGGYATVDHALPAGTLLVWHSYVLTLGAAPGEPLTVSAVGSGSNRLVDVQVLADNSIRARIYPPSPGAAVVIATLGPQAAGTQVRVDVRGQITTPGSTASAEVNIYAGDIGKATPNVASGNKTTATTLTELRSARLGITAATTAVQSLSFDREIADSAFEPAGPASPPAAPVVVAGPSGPGTASVTWTVTSTGTTPLASQEVQYSTTATGPWTSASSTLDGALRAYTITGLVNGTGYYVRVRAVNATSASSWSNIVGPLTPATTGSAVSAPVGDVVTLGCSGVGSTTDGLWTALADEDATTYVIIPAGTYLQELMQPISLPLPAGKQLTVELVMLPGGNGTVTPALYDGDVFIASGEPFDLPADGITQTFTLSSTDLAKISGGGTNLEVRATVAAGGYIAVAPDTTAGSGVTLQQLQAMLAGYAPIASAHLTGTPLVNGLPIVTATTPTGGGTGGGTTGSTLTATSNSDGTVTLTGSAVTVNSDGTVTVPFAADPDGNVTIPLG